MFATFRMTSVPRPSQTYSTSLKDSCLHAAPSIAKGKYTIFFNRLLFILIMNLIFKLVAGSGLRLSIIAKWTRLSTLNSVATATALMELVVGSMCVFRTILSVITQNFCSSSSSSRGTNLANRDQQPSVIQTHFKVLTAAIRVLQNSQVQLLSIFKAQILTSQTLVKLIILATKCSSRKSVLNHMDK